VVASTSGLGHPCCTTCLCPAIPSVAEARESDEHHRPRRWLGHARRKEHAAVETADVRVNWRIAVTGDGAIAVASRRSDRGAHINNSDLVAAWASWEISCEARKPKVAEIEEEEVVRPSGERDAAKVHGHHIRSEGCRRIADECGKGLL
jgi:hypothetical protein